jgi:NADPH:quinone reductase-like Zn-dependent oxidoreductase
VRPIVGPRFDFEQLPDAHRALASRKTEGKVVVTVSGAPSATSS